MGTRGARGSFSCFLRFAPQKRKEITLQTAAGEGAQIREMQSYKFSLQEIVGRANQETEKHGGGIRGGGGKDLMATSKTGRGKKKKKKKKQGRD